MKKDEKELRKLDIKASLDVLGVGQAAESVEGIVSTVIESDNFKKISTGYFLNIIIMTLIIIVVVIVSKLNIPAFTGFRFDVILYIWFGFMGLYSILFFIFGSKEKNRKK